MRILHVTTRHISGGAAKNVRFSVEWELQHGHVVHVAGGPSSDWRQIPWGADTHVIPDLVRAVRPAADLRAIRQLAALMQRHRFDVVHTHLSKAGIVGRIAARRRVPVVVHTIHMASFGRGYSPVSSRVFRTAEQYCARSTDFFVSVGEELKRDYLAAGIGHRKQYSIIRSPLEPAAFTAMRGLSERERLGLRAKFAAPEKARIIVVAGMLEPRKRHDLVLHSLAPLLRNANTHLYIAGEGYEETKLRTLARQSGIETAVRLLGHIENLPELFAISDVFVHAATAEGVPQVVVQALCAGVPVVATETQGLREVPEAPIRIVPSTGLGLCKVVEQTLLSPRTSPAAAELFAPWSSESISAALTQLHELLEHRLAGGERSSRDREAVKT